MADAGAEIAVGDLDVPASIDEAMASVTAVVLVSPAVPAQELNVVSSAARAGVGHIVKATSKASADSPIARRRGRDPLDEGPVVRVDILRPRTRPPRLLVARQVARIHLGRISHG